MNQQRHSPDIALAVFTAVGVTAGVILSLGFDEDYLVRLCGVGRKISLAGGGNWFAVFMSSFGGSAILLGAAFLLGFSAIAQPAELLLVGFRGLGLGLCVRGVYLGGNVLSSMAAFLPFAVFSTAVLILSAREAFYLSQRYLALSTTDENRLGIRSQVRDYSARFMIYFLLLAVLAAGDTFLAGVLASA